MRYASAAWLLTIVLSVQAIQAQKKLAIIGSSTSACANIANFNNCYVGLLENHYNQTFPFDTTVEKLALGGTNCYNGMPSSYTVPYPDAVYQINPARNITYALSLHPDVVIVNYPTNAYDVLSVTEIMYCLRTIRDSANKKGVPCFVSTTQPRTGYDLTARTKLKELRDSIVQEMGAFALNFWDGLADPADYTILPAYRSPIDDIHLNEAGHAILYQRVLNANIFSATLPATFLQFSTVNKNNSNIIQWLTSRETDVNYYQLERSADAKSFVAIGTVNANNSYGNNQYQFTDEQPLSGLNYYKIVIVDRDGKKHASPVMTVRTGIGKTSITKAFAASATQVAVEMQSNARQTVQLQLVNNMGVLLSTVSRLLETGSTTFYLNTPVLSNGIYHLRLKAGETSSVSSFIKN